MFGMAILFLLYFLLIPGAVLVFRDNGPGLGKVALIGGILWPILLALMAVGVVVFLCVCFGAGSVFALRNLIKKEEGE